MNFEKLIQGLNDDDVAKIKVLVDKRLAGKETVKEVDTSNDQEIYFAIQNNVTQRGTRGIPWAVFRTSQDARTLSKRSEWLVDFINKNMKPTKRVEFIWCLRFSVQLVTTFLESNSLPVSTRTIINNLDRVPVLLDNQFPGYMRECILSVIVKQANMSKEDIHG